MLQAALSATTYPTEEEAFAEPELRRLERWSARAHRLASWLLDSAASAAGAGPVVDDKTCDELVQAWVAELDSLASSGGQGGTRLKSSRFVYATHCEALRRIISDFEETTETALRHLPALHEDYSSRRPSWRDLSTILAIESERAVDADAQDRIAAASSAVAGVWREALRRWEHRGDADA